jgi:hypothetical protein
MQKITSAEELKEAIRQLEDKRFAEKELLKEEFSVAKERLKPSNVLKSTFSNVFSGSNLIRTVMVASLGITAAVVSKKYFQGITGRFLGKLLGRII